MTTFCITSSINFPYWFANIYIFHIDPDGRPLAFLFPFILPRKKQEMEKNIFAPKFKVIALTIKLCFLLPCSFCNIKRKKT